MRKLTATEQVKVQELSLRGLKLLRDVEEYRRYAATLHRKARERLVEAKVLLDEVEALGEALTEGNE